MPSLPAKSPPQCSSTPGASTSSSWVIPNAVKFSAKPTTTSPRNSAHRPQRRPDPGRLRRGNRRGAHQWPRAGSPQTPVHQRSGALTADEFSRILLAYELVWGGLGRARWLRPEIAAAAHSFLRRCAGEKFSVAHASTLRILYGGSVKPDNIKGLMAQEELDGVLVDVSQSRPEIVRVDRKFSGIMFVGRSFISDVQDARRGFSP